MQTTINKKIIMTQQYDIGLYVCVYDDDNHGKMLDQFVLSDISEKDFHERIRKELSNEESLST